MSHTATTLLEVLDNEINRPGTSANVRRLRTKLAKLIGEDEVSKLLVQAGIPGVIINLKHIKRAERILRAALDHVESKPSAPSPAARPASLPTTAPSPVTIRHVASQPAATAPYTRSQCLAIMAGAFDQGPMAFIERSDTEVFEAMQSAVSASRVTLPQVRDKDEGPAITGHAAIFRAAKQDRINAVIKSFKAGTKPAK